MKSPNQNKKKRISTYTNIKKNIHGTWETIIKIKI